jgi:fibronectin type 3 domain-containing protein
MSECNVVGSLQAGRLNAVALRYAVLCAECDVVSDTGCGGHVSEMSYEVVIQTTPTYVVNLSWNASTSSDISGYNIYRAVYSNSTCGAFSKINSSLNTSTAYADSMVLDGTSYCYATTAVNSSSDESAYSNIVSNVQVPAP